jgi:hypothetical protein
MYESARKVVYETVALNGKMRVSFKKEAETIAEKDDCGYSGTNLVINLPNGEYGEVQINVPTIMYGKMAQKDYMAQLRETPDGYEKLKSEYGLPGGYGHVLYELYRVGKGSPRSIAAASLSKEYYGLLRLAPNAPRQACQEWKDAVNAFRRSDPVVEATFLHAGLLPVMSLDEWKKVDAAGGRGRSTAIFERGTRDRSNNLTGDQGYTGNARERSNAMHRKLDRRPGT